MIKAFVTVHQVTECYHLSTATAKTCMHIQSTQQPILQCTVHVHDCVIIYRSFEVTINTWQLHLLSQCSWWRTALSEALGVPKYIKTFYNRPILNKCSKVTLSLLCLEYNINVHEYCVGTKCTLCISNGFFRHQALFSVSCSCSLSSSSSPPVSGYLVSFKYMYM